MKNAIAVIVLIGFFISCSKFAVKDPANQIESKPIESEEILIYEGEIKEKIMLKKGFREKKETENFGPNIFSILNGNTLTTDINIIKWINRANAFSLSVFARDGMGIDAVFVILKIQDSNGKSINCLTEDPFYFGNEDSKQYREIVEEGLKTHTYYLEVPWMDNPLIAEENVVKKYCLPFDPQTKFINMDRRTLEDKYLISTGKAKTFCKNSSKNKSVKCKIIDKKDENSLVYALIEKGFFVYKNDGCVVVLPFGKNIFYNDNIGSSFLFQ